MFYVVQAKIDLELVVLELQSDKQRSDVILE